VAEKIGIVLSWGTTPASWNISRNIGYNSGGAATDRSRCRPFHDLGFQMSKVVYCQVCSVVAIGTEKSDTI